jgi:glycosyltransferase involved in cell wall biosynthesis
MVTRVADSVAAPTASGRRERRLLVLAPSYPFPPRDGVQLRLGNLLRLVPAGWRLEVLCAEAGATGSEEPLPAPLIGTAVRLPLPSPPTGFAASPWAQVLRSDASMIWKFRSPEFAAEVRRRSQGADGVLAVGLQMAQYLAAVAPGVPTAVDNYNVESRILGRLAETRAGLKRAYWLREAAKLRRAEVRFLRAAGRVWAISEEDRDAMADLTGATPLQTVPMGIDLDYFSADGVPPFAPSSSPRFLFVGALNWHVNEDAAAWFVAEVWPCLRSTLPTAEFHLVGRDPSPTIQALGESTGVTVVGTVPDIRPHLRAASVVVVPLRYGSGVRTKILEAFAAGRPVVSTSVGAEGLRVVPGRHLLLAEEADAFAEACAALVRDGDRAAALVAAGREFVAEQDRAARSRFQAAFEAAFGAVFDSPGVPTGCP